jgi:hypothetical protein
VLKRTMRISFGHYRRRTFRATMTLVTPLQA